MLLKTTLFSAALCAFSSLSLPQVMAQNVVIGAVGDVMMGSDYPRSKLPPRPEELFSHAAGILKSVDIAFGNLEGTIGSGGTSSKSGPNSYSFRTPPEYVEHLAEAGFDVMSLANNHAMDFGSKGLAQTKRILDSESIDHSARDGGIAEFNVNGVRVAFLAASTYGEARNITSPRRLFAEIEKEAAKYDIFVVSVHAGAEGRNKIRTRNETEYAFGENRGNVVAFAHEAIDRGADLILMHGPHVPRAMEVYKDRLIAYSLGNFCTYGGFGLSGPLGLAPLLEVQLDSQGRLIAGMVHSFLQKAPGGPVLDQRKDRQKTAAGLIEALSYADFPQSAPLFDSAGGFTPPQVIQLQAK